MTTELDETVTYPIPGPHDRRCELVVNWLRTHAKTCRCERRRIIRNLSLELGNVTLLSSEGLAHAQPQATELMSLTIGRMMRALQVALDEHEREVIPSSLTITSAHNREIEGVAVRVEVLTLPTGTLQDTAALEVAADWVARKYALRA